MKIVLNRCFGGFGINEKAYDALKRNGEVDKEYNNTDVFYSDDELYRYSPTLISMIEDGIDCSGSHAKLCVADIPDAATDYMIKEYDGVESVIYVLDGKLHTIG